MPVFVHNSSAARRKKTLINQKPVEGDIKNSNDDYLINSFLSISKVQYFIIQELSPDNESH